MMSHPPQAPRPAPGGPDPYDLSASPGVPTTPGAPTAYPQSQPLDEGERSYQRYQDEDRSIGEIASDVLANASTLIRQEIELAKVELKEDGKRAGKGAGLLTGAGIAAFMALFALTLMAWWAIGIGIGDYDEPALGWSGLIVTVIWLAIAGVLALLGKKELQRVEGMPKTQDTVKKIPNAAAGNEEKNR